MSQLSEHGSHAGSRVLARQMHNWQAHFPQAIIRMDDVALRPVPYLGAWSHRVVGSILESPF
jgi:hypothetical protein